MSTGLIWQTESTSSEQTEQLAESLGKCLHGGEAIELISDLGGGKTTFVRGLARGVGSTDKVSSPSFTLSNEYKAGPLTLRHYDFYRLSEPGILKDEIMEGLQDLSAITVVEWGDIVESVLPDTVIKVTIRVTAADARLITFNYPESAQYLLPSR